MGEIDRNGGIDIWRKFETTEIFLASSCLVSGRRRRRLKRRQRQQRRRLKGRQRQQRRRLKGRQRRRRRNRHQLLSRLIRLGGKPLHNG